MATQVQWRRGTTAQVAAFTGAVGEVVIDTTLKQLVVQDGVTAGGFYAARATGGTLTNITLAGASNVFTGATIAGGTFTSPTLNTPTITNPTVTTGTFSSPTFTGTPITPTQALTDNSTQVVNSSWVRQVINLTSPINFGLATAFAGAGSLGPPGPN